MRKLIIITLLAGILYLPPIHAGNPLGGIVVEPGYPYYERSRPKLRHGFRKRNYPIYRRNYFYRPYDYTRPDALYRYWNNGHNFYEYERHRWQKKNYIPN